MAAEGASEMRGVGESGIDRGLCQRSALHHACHGHEKPSPSQIGSQRQAGMGAEAVKESALRQTRLLGEGRGGEAIR